jgi:hypothetical protein
LNSIPNRDSSPDAFRLAARLELYGSHLDAADGGRNPASWHSATQELKDMVAMSHALPQFAVDIIDIARQHLLVLGSVASSSHAVPLEDWDRLRVTAASLREKCLGLVRH